MSARRERSLTILLVIPLVLAFVLASTSLVGCRGSADDEAAPNATGSGDSAAADTGATTTEGTQAATGDSNQDTSNPDSGNGLTREEQDDAIGIAKAYFVAKTDFTSDQFDWKLEAAAQDNEGDWWVRVSATPKEGTASDPAQLYVTRPADFELWVAHGMSPEIDPATDENMPEEVRGRI